MLALGIDTSSAAGSVGLVDDAGLVGELNLHAGRTHSERLLPSIHALLESAGVRSAQVDLLAVAAGPGSFTGLRIGMATAKGLALALGRPLLGFSTLETIAWSVVSGLPGELRQRAICVLLDAGRGELYRGLFRCEDDRVFPLAAEAAVSRERAVDQLPEGCLLCGDGIAVLGARLASSLGGPTLIVPSTPFIGSALARRALKLARRSGLGNLPPLTPNYLRPSDAERTFKG